MVVENKGGGVSKDQNGFGYSGHQPGTTGDFRIIRVMKHSWVIDFNLLRAVPFETDGAFEVVASGIMSKFPKSDIDGIMYYRRNRHPNKTELMKPWFVVF